MPAIRLIFGFHAVTTRLRQNPDSIAEVFLDATRRDQRARDLAKQVAFHGIRLIACDDNRLSGMAGSTKHQGVAANIDASRSYIDIDDVIDTLVEPALLLVLDGIHDPHNLGACLRVADAFGVHAVIAPKDRAVGLSATVHKVASGAADVVPYISVTNLARSLRALKQRGVTVIGTAAEAGGELNSTRLEGPLAWVMGAEGRGMRRLTREACDRLISIPMLGTVPNLNISVSAGICLFETRRQRAQDNASCTSNQGFSPDATY